MFLSLLFIFRAYDIALLPHTLRGGVAFRRSRYSLNAPAGFSPVQFFSR